MSTTKTHKSYLKRLKVTRTGKILARAKGQNHFNARERTNTSINKRKMQGIKMSNKVRSRFLMNIQ